MCLTGKNPPKTQKCVTSFECVEGFKHLCDIKVHRTMNYSWPGDACTFKQVTFTKDEPDICLNCISLHSDFPIWSQGNRIPSNMGVLPQQR